MKNLFLVFAFLISLSASAHINNNALNEEAHLPILQEEAFVFVHITAVLEIQKRTAKGVIAKVVDIQVGKVANKGKNEFTGSMQLKAGKVQIQFDRSPKRPIKIIMPKGFELSKELSEKLGASQQVVMSGGSTMLKPQVDSMLWFEIQ